MWKFSWFRSWIVCGPKKMIDFNWFKLIFNWFQFTFNRFHLIFNWFQFTSIYFQVIVNWFQFTFNWFSIDFNLLSTDFNLLSIKINLLSIDFQFTFSFFSLPKVVVHNRVPSKQLHYWGSEPFMGYHLEKLSGCCF